MELNHSLPRVLVIVGPTASGKTALALQIARLIPSEIISADSRQVYKLLTIGTGKPSAEELKQVQHHFIDTLMPDQHFNAGDFGTLARETVAQILDRKRLPIVVGGTGLYIRSLIDGLFAGPGREKEIRDALESRLKSEGPGSLLEELRNVDPDAAKRMIPSNHRRIIRALEVYYTTGKPISIHHEEQKAGVYYDSIMVALDWKREVLYNRINSRVDTMLAAGFLDEVKGVVSQGYDDRHKSLQTVGYKEAIGFLRSEISYDRMVELMKQNTRRFAKRQLTWFRRDQRIRWLRIAEEGEIPHLAQDVLKMIGEK